MIWDARTGGLLRRYSDVCPTPITAICFDDRERKLLVADHAGHILVLNYASKTLRATTDEPGCRLAYAPDLDLGFGLGRTARFRPRGVAAAAGVPSSFRPCHHGFGYSCEPVRPKSWSSGHSRDHDLDPEHSQCRDQGRPAHAASPALVSTPPGSEFQRKTT